MEETLRNLAERHDLGLRPAGEGWELTLPRRGDYACRMSIGPGTFEWYAEVTRGPEARKVWSDYVECGEEDPLAEKRRAIATFVLAWIASIDVRETGGRRSTRVEWRREGEWSEIASWWSPTG